MRFATLTLISLCLLACGDDDDDDKVLDAGADGAVDASGPDAATECADPLPTPANCDFFLSCGCDTADEKCSIDANTRGCFGFGKGAAGATCTIDSDCVPGTLCAGLDAATRRCLSYCDNAHACGAGEACYVRAASQVVATLCGQVCDLREQNCLAPAAGCYPASFINVVDKGACVTAGPGEDGANCKVANDCKEGFTCIERTSTCRKLCDRGDNNPDCPSNFNCAELIGHTQTGYCVPE